MPLTPTDWRNQKGYGGKSTVDKNVNWSNLSGGWSGSIYQRFYGKHLGSPEKLYLWVYALSHIGDKDKIKALLMPINRKGKRH